jgi:hypothetical protein
MSTTRGLRRLPGAQEREGAGDTCPRGLLAALRKLDEPTLKTRTGGLLTKGQIDGVLGAATAS